MAILICGATLIVCVLARGNHRDYYSGGENKLLPQI